MPNTAPALDNVDEIEGVLERGRDAANARVHTVGCGTIGRHGDTIAPNHELIQTGAIGISDDGDGIADDAMMRRILEAVAAADTCFMQHCQDPATTKGSVMNAGPLAMKLGLRGWPASAEEAMLERDLQINADINARYHAQHLSSGGSVELIRAAQAAGQPATGEASPHHARNAGRRQRLRASGIEAGSGGSGYQGLASWTSPPWGWWRYHTLP